MHLEELVALGSKTDSVMAMARFLIAKFPSVVNKLMPTTADPAEMRAMMETDDFFNELDYDEAVKCMAHVLLVSAKLFPYNAKRPDANVFPKMYSEVTGLHSLPWGVDVKKNLVEAFNSCVDQIRVENRKLGGKGAQLNKDKTRPLQFIAPLDVFEKVITYLLMKAGVPNDQQLQLSGEDIVTKIANLDIDKILIELRVRDISPAATQAAVDGAVALAAWFQTSFEQVAETRSLVQTFKNERMLWSDVPVPTFKVAVDLLGIAEREHSNVWKTLQDIKAGFNLRSFVLVPSNSAPVVAAKKFDLIVLALMGFVVVDKGRFCLAAYPISDEDYLTCANRLLKWDRAVSFRILRDIVPEAGIPKPTLQHEVCDDAMLALQTLLDDGSTNIEKHFEIFVPDIALPRLPPSPPPASQEEFSTVHPSHGSRLKSVLHVPEDGLQAYTQGDEEGAATKKLRTEGPLALEDFIESKDITRKLLIYCLQSRAVHGIEAQAVRKKYENECSQVIIHGAVSRSFQLLEEMGLGKRGGRGGSMSLRRPPADNCTEIADSLAKTLGETPAKAAVLLEALRTRHESSAWDMDTFRQKCGFLQDALKV